MRNLHMPLLGAGESTSLQPVRERIVAGIEVAIGGAVVVGHNVFHLLPNEVPVLVLLLGVSLILRRKKLEKHWPGPTFFLACHLARRANHRNRSAT